MKQHDMHLQAEYFDLIKSGQKTIELRLWDEKRRQIAVGDIITFTNRATNESIKTKVKYLVIAENFKSLYDLINVKRTGFETKETAIQTIEQFWDKKAQQKHGVVGIWIEMPDKNKLA